MMAHPSTQALHADGSLDRVNDVAPPIHLSTTFRYPDEPENLIPSEDPVVCNGSSLPLLQGKRLKKHAGGI